MPSSTKVFSIFSTGSRLLSRKGSNSHATSTKSDGCKGKKPQGPLTGSCMCGAVSYKSTDEPEFNALCHCIDCQKWTGAAFTSNSVVSECSFHVTKGAPKVYDVIGDSGKINSHYFCGDCGSSLYTKAEILEGKVLIKGGGLDNGWANLDNKIAVELYVKDRVAYMGAIKNSKQAQRMP